MTAEASSVLLVQGHLKMAHWTGFPIPSPLECSVAFSSVSRDNVSQGEMFGDDPYRGQIRKGWRARKFEGKKKTVKISTRVVTQLTTSKSNSILLAKWCSAHKGRTHSGEYRLKRVAVYLLEVCSDRLLKRFITQRRLWESYRGVNDSCE